MSPTRPEVTGRRRLHSTSAQPETLADDLLIGAQAIADFTGLALRKTFYMLERQYLPAKKCGHIWTTTRSALRRHFNGEGTADAAE
jgi:hypothetical protein